MRWFCLVYLIVFAAFEYAASLCSSDAYSAEMKEILSTKQSDYDIYEGDFIFLPAWSDPIGTNPGGIYGVTSFYNINITDPYSQTSAFANYTYFMRSSNAIIFPFCTPPKATYFSLVPYILDRFNFVKDGTYKERQMIFGALSPSLNHLLWNTSNIDSNIFDSLSLFIQTPDQMTYEFFNELLITNGVNSKDINFQSIPSIFSNFLPYEYNALNVKKSYNKTYDTGLLLMRIAIPLNETANNIYTNITQKVYMLQPKNATGNKAKVKYEPTRRSEYSPQNMNETTIYKSILDQYGVDLVQYMEETYNFKYVNATIVGPWPPGSAPTECNYWYPLEHNDNVGGNNCDDVYNQINVGATLHSTTYFLIIGIMHSNADIAQTTYSNIAYYDHMYAPFKPDPTINCLQYNGSGLILPIKTNISREYLKNIFVVQIAGNPNCIKELPGLCVEPYVSYIYADLAIRNYLNPITKTAPLSTQLVPSILLRFNL